jgi:hypothetical protein
METKKYDLLLIEPWEAYGKYNVALLDTKNNNFLFKLTNPLIFQGNTFDFLIGKLRYNNENEFSNSISGKYIFNLFFDQALNNDSLKQIEKIKFRSNFLIGEIEI